MIALVKFLKIASLAFLFSISTLGFAKLELHYEMKVDSGVLVLSYESKLGHKYVLEESDDYRDWEVSGLSAKGDGSVQSFEASIREKAALFRIVESLDTSLVSAITGIEYPIHVYVPDGYAESEEDYPIIYATDGQWVTQGFSSAIEEKGKEVILITIEQGPGDRRAIDYLFPGSYDYYGFLRDELVPAVESLYRVDPDRRTLCGTSYGGLLVGSVLLMDDAVDPVFSTYLAFDGSFWQSRAGWTPLVDSRYELNSRMDVTLYLTSATGFQNNDGWVTVFENRLKQREYEGLLIHRRSYPVEHNDVAQPSFEEALDDLF